MYSIRRCLVESLVALAAMAMACATAQAEPIAPGPITVVLPFSAGGTSDQAMRILATTISQSTGQQIIVDNRTGANGAVAAGVVKQAKADGTTLMWASIGTHAINSSLYAKLSYDPVKDFEPITLVFTSTHFLLVPATSPAKSVADLVALAKKSGNGLAFASVGAGSGSHLVAEMFKAKTQIAATHLPYRGSTSAIPDVVSGRIDFFFDGPTSAPLVRDGKLRALAATDSKRAPVLPDVPTMAEAGFGGIELNAWFGLVAPAGTPKAMLARLNAEFTKALRNPEVQRKFAEFGGAAAPSTPAEFAALMAAETERLGKLVKASGARAD